MKGHRAGKTGPNFGYRGYVYYQARISIPVDFIIIIVYILLDLGRHLAPFDYVSALWALFRLCRVKPLEDLGADERYKSWELCISRRQ